MKRLHTKTKSTSASAPRGTALTIQQRWTFRLIALLSPALLLAVIEIFLRISGYGYPASFFLHQRLNGRDVLIDNWQFGWRFFPREMARTPQPVVFTPHKAPGTIRIFVLGESAAMGDPEPSFGLPRLLQVMLEQKFPSNNFEVINVAMTAINSHVIREIAKDCAPLEGDVWIVYAGNNEVVGPFGGGTVFTRQVPGLAFIRGTLWLKRFRVGQLLGSFGKRGPGEWQGMEMFLKQQVRRDDPRMEKVYAHFQKNVEDIVRIGSRAGAKVLIGTVAVNLRDSPPFASQHTVAVNEAEFSTAMDRVLTLESRGEFSAAYSALAAARPEAGDDYAATYFHLARCELALGSNDSARANFKLARENDTLRFRADDGINRQIRGISGARFIDTEQAIAAASSNSIPGAEFFYEHVHFTFAGTYLLARTFADEVIRLLPHEVTNRGVRNFPTLEDCARRLAWTDWDRLQVFEEVRKRLQQPPFNAQFGHAQRDAEWKKRIDELGVALTEKKFQRIDEQYSVVLRLAPDDWVLRENFAKMLEANGEPVRAMEQWREMMRLLPQDTQAHYHLGNLLDAMGRSDEALPFFREALRRNPELVEARNGLALALSNLGRFVEAGRELNFALRLKPKFAEARVNLGHLLAQTGRTNEAIAQYERAIQTDSNSAAAHVNLGKLLNLRGERAGAIAHYENAVRIDPKHAVAHYNLGNALLAQNPQAAAQHYAEAVRGKPDFAEAHLALALELARVGNVAEAQTHFADALRLQPDSPDAHFNYGVLLAKQGRFTEAAKQFSETLRLQPGHPQAREFRQRVEQRR